MQETTFFNMGQKFNLASTIIYKNCCTTHSQNNFIGGENIFILQYCVWCANVLYLLDSDNPFHLLVVPWSKMKIE